jgi:hypothetical protein
MNFTIADVLHLAADKYLAKDRTEYWLTSTAVDDSDDESVEKFSCCAIQSAVYDLCKTPDGHDHYFIEKVTDYIFAGLQAMGLDTNSTEAFPDNSIDGYVDVNSSVQQDRYFWLKWAALMAEEQGV